MLLLFSFSFSSLYSIKSEYLLFSDLSTQNLNLLMSMYIFTLLTLKHYIKRLHFSITRFSLKFTCIQFLKKSLSMLFLLQLLINVFGVHTAQYLLSSSNITLICLLLFFNVFLYQHRVIKALIWYIYEKYVVSFLVSLVTSIA